MCVCFLTAPLELLICRHIRCVGNSLEYYRSFAFIPVCVYFKRVSGCHDITEYIRINAHIYISPAPVLETSRGALYHISTGKGRIQHWVTHTHAVKTLYGSVCRHISFLCSGVHTWDWCGMWPFMVLLKWGVFYVMLFWKPVVKTRTHFVCCMN